MKKPIELKRIKIPIKIRIPIITVLGIILIISAFSTYSSYQEPTSTEKEYTALTYRHSGFFDYFTILKNNTVYDNRTVLYPNEGTIFKKITEDIYASFLYYLQFSLIKNEKNSNNIYISGNYNIQAEIQTILWNKTYTLIPTTPFNTSEKTASFNVDFPINVSFYEEIVNNISSEIGITTANPLLVIKCNITTNTKIGDKTIYDSFIPSINVTLNKDTIEISENLSFTESGSITDTEKVFHQEIINNRNNWIFISIIFLILFLLSLIISKNKIETFTKTEKMIKKIYKKYGEWIVKVEDTPKIPKKTGIIKTKSFDDLIKTGEELGKPIIHYTSEKDKKHTFYVIDYTIIYEHSINFSEEKIENNKQNDLIEDKKESKIPEEIEKTIIELIKENVPYEGIQSQTEYQDEKGELTFPTRKEVNKIRKTYIKMKKKRNKQNIKKINNNYYNKFQLVLNMTNQYSLKITIIISEKINIQRKKIGKKPLEIIKNPHVLADDRRPISSSRIIKNEINSKDNLL